MVFVDSNVPMYLVGQPHPSREHFAAYLRANAQETFVTSAEVHQEVIHRYIAINEGPRSTIVSRFSTTGAAGLSHHPRRH